MEKINTGPVKIDIPPVGVTVLPVIPASLSGVEVFSGVSYCQAILMSGKGKHLVVKPESIQVCQWVPIVLGFKSPENDFERSIAPHLTLPASGVYLASIDLFDNSITPDVVIIRTNPYNFSHLFQFLGKEHFIDPAHYNRDATALSFYHGNPARGVNGLMLKWFNRFLDTMNRFAWWQKFTELLFTSTTISRLFDKFITRYLANMSMCRNSTVIPLITGKANISNFCAGGIAWGKNSASQMTAGFPYHVYRKIAHLLEYPGKNKHAGQAI
ncbi:MAG: hypothetical protein ACOCWZ_06175 [Spirochaetota bacterium]